MPEPATVDQPTAKAILADLEAMGAEATRKIYARQGVVGTIFGVKLGELRALAKKLKRGVELKGYKFEKTMVKDVLRYSIELPGGKFEVGRVSLLSGRVRPIGG